MDTYSTNEGVIVCGKEHKWEYLVIESTTTIIIILFLSLGRPIMRSIDMSIHTLLRRKLPMAQGVPQETKKPQKSIPFQYAREIKHLKLKDLKSYLILNG